MRLLTALLKAVFSGISIFALFACNASGDAEVSKASQTKIKLMTSLPLIWGEGASITDVIGGKSKPAAIFAHWRDQYTVEAVDSLESLAGSDTDIIMLAQPPAMDPADLASLDEWVRQGGNAIIFTDPLLVWPSDLPIGDNRRPLATGLLSPLLGHWGLELNMPGDGGADIVNFEFDNLTLTTVGAGSFAAAGKAVDQCKFSDENFIAFCKIGAGNAILVADADFLHENLWINDDREQNKTSDAMRFVDSLIAELEEKRPVSND